MQFLLDTDTLALYIFHGLSPSSKQNQNKKRYYLLFKELGLMLKSSTL